MSEQELIDAVTGKLTGKLYVGQQVRIHPNNRILTHGLVGLHGFTSVDDFVGTVVGFDDRHVVVRMGNITQRFDPSWFTGEDRK